MKHLPLQNPRYIALLKEFSLHVKRLGYNKYSQQSLPSSVREFFYRLEQQDIHSLDGMTPELISRHYEYLSRRPNQTRPGNLSQSMLQSHVWALKTFFNYQEAEGNVKENPFSVLHFPAPKHARREVLTREEIRKLYRACETPRDRAMLGLFYGCGLRKSEAEKLNLKDISFRSRLLYVRSGKGKKRRVVPVTGKVIEDLQNYYYQERVHIRKKEDPDSRKSFMLNRWGERMHGQSYWRRLQYLVQKAGIHKSGRNPSDLRRISPHSLRHSIATHLLDRGLSVEQVRDFLGHSHLESTQVYTRVNRDHLI